MQKYFFKKIVLIYFIYFVVSLIKVLAAKIVSHEWINVIDEILVIQVAAFIIWMFYSVLQVSKFSRKEKTIILLSSILLFIPVVLISIQVSFVFWLELGLPY